MSPEILNEVKLLPEKIPPRTTHGTKLHQLSDREASEPAHDEVIYLHADSPSTQKEKLAKLLNDIEEKLQIPKNSIIETENYVRAYASDKKKLFHYAFVIELIENAVLCNAAIKAHPNISTQTIVNNCETDSIAWIPQLGWFTPPKDEVGVWNPINEYEIGGAIASYELSKKDKSIVEFKKFCKELDILPGSIKLSGVSGRIVGMEGSTIIFRVSKNPQLAEALENLNTASLPISMLEGFLKRETDMDLIGICPEQGWFSLGYYVSAQQCPDNRADFIKLLGAKHIRSHSRFSGVLEELLQLKDNKIPTGVLSTEISGLMMRGGLKFEQLNLEISRSSRELIIKTNSSLTKPKEWSVTENTIVRKPSTPTPVSRSRG